MARPKKNNIDYFSHDNSMRNDRKIKALRAKFGLEGYAVFCMMLEILSEAELLIIKWNHLELELISGDLNIVSEKLTQIIDYLCEIDLLIKSENHIYCIKLDERAKTIFDKRTNDLNSLRNINGINIEKTLVSGGESTQSKVKYSKVNKSKVISFLDFWEQYHIITKKNKTDKEAALKYWKRLSEKEKQKAIDNIQDYYNSLNDKKYCKIARTYLDKKNFNDEFGNVKPKKKPSNYGYPEESEERKRMMGYPEGSKQYKKENE